MERKEFDRNIPLQLSIDAKAKQQRQTPAALTASGEVNPIGTSSSFSPPCFLKSVQAALKRHRPLGTMQTDALRARRVPVRQRQPSRPANGPVAAVTGENGPPQESDLLAADGDLGVAYNQEKVSSEDFSPTLSFGSGSSPQEFPVGEVSIAAGQGPVQQQQPIKTLDVPIAAITSGNSRNQVTDPMVGCGSSDARFGQEKSILDEISLSASSNPGCITTWLEHGVGNGIAAVSSNLVHIPHVPSQIASFDIHHKKMQPFSFEEIGSRFQGEPKGTGENERVTMCISADGFPSHRTSIALTERENLGGIPPIKDQALKQQVPQQTEMSEVSVKLCAAHPVAKIPGRGYDPQPEDPIIQCSTMGSTCVTTMSIHSGPPQSTGAASAARTTVPTQVLAGSAEVQDVAYINGLGAADKESDRLLEHQKAPQFDVSAGGKGVRGDASNLHPLNPPNNSSSIVDMDPSKSNRGEKASRKKKYDPDLFFKVNGKLYQKLGKIGSGGSSEVYKVIASDCNIFALKRIKLKGRDYPTACGFCQEIEYLNKLEGRNNIIRLVDYEVTDKTLLEEVMTGCMAMKDGRIKADSNIYMVLEYGEIDLAHMLSQKLKDSASLTWNSKENWIRFYWQQMLEAVNMIHEERIVHSDLKPANFLLVKGSLKLIDFGIAKAILSDTTNIQRDAQVGTLNYMSPEAFMWNEQDESGSTIKCGRPSDIWSLGCILYQMVYGKTPFADYKTFWAKFKVITDRNYEIVYDPIPNPWLIDLLKKCLAWNRDERWRIPQLLQHPFLNPPFSPLE